jgi:integrase
MNTGEEKEIEPVDTARTLIAENPLPRFRTQTGVLVEYSDGWHTRYYDSDPTNRFKRKRVAFWLCAKDTEREVRERLQAEHIKRVNARQKGLPHVNVDKDELTIGHFWIDKRLPVLEGPLKSSWATVRTYKKLWKLYIGPHLDGKNLKTYRTVDAKRWLEGLVTGETTRKGKPLNASSYQLVRSIVSGLFSQALNNEIIEVNPITAVKLDAKVTPWRQGKAYSVDDVKKMLGALEGGPQLFFAFAALQGLRPAEVAGLRFEDVDVARGRLRIARSCPSGHVQEIAKTLNSVAEIPLSARVAELYEAYSKTCGRDHGFVFCRRAGRPVDTADYMRRFFVPVAERIGVKWIGLYACRRFYSTTLTECTDSTEAAYNNTRDTKETVDKHYSLRITAAGVAGQKKLDALMAA